MSTSLPLAQICHLDGGPDGQIRILFFFPFTSLPDAGKDGLTYARGIVAIEDSQDICVGCSNGDVLVFELKSSSTVELRRSLSGHATPLTSLAASATQLVSADEVGDIRMWETTSAYAQCGAFASLGYPCTSVGVREDIVAAGFSTGHLRIFRTKTSELVVEVAAHSRCINAIDIHAHQPLVVTVGEDTFVNIWSLPDFESKGSGEVSLLFSSCAKDQLLTGVQFMHDGTSNIATAAYDVEQLSVWARS